MGGYPRAFWRMECFPRTVPLQALSTVPPLGTAQAPPLANQRVESASVFRSPVCDKHGVRVKKAGKWDQTQ